MRLKLKQFTLGWLMILAALSLPAWAESREEFHKTVALQADGSFSLKNINGNVTVLGWDRKEAQIDAVKTASSEKKLHEANIEVNGSGYSVNVETRYPSHTNNDPARVEYTIHLPRSARVAGVETVNGEVKIDGISGRIHASTVNGKMEVWNASGELELDAVNGEIKASLLGAGHSAVKLNTVNGNLILGMVGEVNARIKATTVNGKIQSELPVSIDKPKYGPGMSVDSTLGADGALIELEAVNGNIYLRKL